MSLSPDPWSSGVIRQGEYKKAGAQLLDIVKISTLTVLWVLPGGSVIAAAVLKSSARMRPSAFQAKRKALVREESPPGRAEAFLMYIGGGGSG